MNQADRPDDNGRDGGLFQSDPAAAPDRRRKRQPASTTQRALGLLVRREHSRKELARKLITRGLDADEVEAAVDKLAEAGWQDDTRFAESLVRIRTAGGYGPLHIRAELGTHGLDSDAIAEALLTFDGDWLENARELISRRYGTATCHDLVLRRKASDLLMRRGFPADIVQAAIRGGPDG
jgi:regulatory protein